MSKTAGRTKEAKGADHKDRPMDRPMGGPLSRDDGQRTEHGLHPLDPSYNGTPVAQNAGIEDAAKARQEAGLSSASSPVAGDLPVGKQSAEG